MSADRLYFAQHGLAKDKTDDPERPLSTTGIEQTQAIARHLRSSGISITHIFHSGKLRASQTAEIIASALNTESVSIADHLSPNDDIALITQDLTNNALYIGHLPHLDKLVSYLICGDEKQTIIKFQNGAIICLDKIDDQYQLSGYLTPELSGTKNRRF